MNWVMIEAEDALAKSCLINSMMDKLMSHFIQCKIVKKDWDAIKKSYLDVSNYSQVYELMEKSFQRHQNGLPLIEY